MELLAEMLTEDATYWAPGPADRFGKATYSAPVGIKCWWYDVSEQFVDVQGRVQISLARVWVNTDLLLEGVLLKANIADLSVEQIALNIKNPGASKIRKVIKAQGFESEHLREVTL